MILDDIALRRREQLRLEMERTPLDEVKRAAERAGEGIDFKAALKKGGLSVIAEAKKASPSKGIICPDFNPVKIAEEYEKAGASAVSCLTEEYYFKGSLDYLRAIREKIGLPVLRKDFIIDPYQIYEAKAAGADAVLLIAAMLDKSTLSEYNKIACGLGLSVLGEAHSREETDNLLEAGCEIIGINNRNLKTFEVSLETTEKLMRDIPKDYVKVSESGIKTNEDMRFVRSCGADAVLIGETLMRSGNVNEAMAELLRGIE